MYSALLLLWSFCVAIKALEITAPVKDFTWNVNEPLTVSWDVAKQGDPESFSVLFMKPGSENYVILAVDTKSSAGSVEVDFPHDKPIEGVAGFVIAFVEPPSTYYAVSNTINISSEPLPASRAPSTRTAAAKDARSAPPASSSSLVSSASSSIRAARTPEQPSTQISSTQPTRGAPTPAKNASSASEADMITTERIGAALAASARPSASSLGIVDVSTSSAGRVGASVGLMLASLAFLA